MPRTISPPAPIAQHLNSCGEIPGCDLGAKKHGINLLLEPSEGRVIDEEFVNARARLYKSQLILVRANKANSCQVLPFCLVIVKWPLAEKLAKDKKEE
jgi:hypothetical protein